MTSLIQAVVIGAGGYVGGELLRLIASHPSFTLAGAVSDSRAGQPIADTFGHLSQALSGKVFIARNNWLDEIQDGSDIAIFSAAPHGASAEIIAAVLDAGNEKRLTMHVVDSSADFRYSEQSAWEAVYGAGHGAPQLLPHFTCAVPEHVDSIATPHVAHPGCFATATLLATVPLMRSGLTEAEVFVSGVTGSTGSGRTPQSGTHHPERNSNLFAYRPLAHRHAPEIAALATAASGRETTVHFVPHSGPFARGIHITLQAKAKTTVSAEQLRDVYVAAYANAPFVEVVKATPNLKHVVASNMCHLGVAADGDSVVVMSVIDNLVKGAAGGAIQWMNRLWDLPETSGLTAPAPGWT
ncbi:MAG: N-acetyl-gamma-glutamyl-phosphate reductase [Proteobacteria bacterium]|nr:N-acetyl-gamma-glutamyl-phosphate reductase [Pseudomonadota bacterium]MCH9005429.1 N-acetyl-gamma-glutamyl-phosphate reductase [Pseudomonadota bacterium]